MLLLSANDQTLGLHELMPFSRPSAQPITIQSCTCVCVCVSAQVCCEQSLSSFFSLASHTVATIHNNENPFSTTH